MAGLYFSLLVVAGLLGLGVRADTTTEASADNEVMLEDAYESWLENFGDYILMEKQEYNEDNATLLESPEVREIQQELIRGEEEEEEEEEGEAGGHEVLQERLDVAEEEGFEERMIRSPVVLALEKYGLLNPYLDYEVWLESQVEEKGLIFVTLNPHENKSRCGLGGISNSLVFSEGENEITTDQNLATTANSTSSWDEFSEDFWWAKGSLEGGSMLGLTFTPPECGCLTLSVFFALPVDNTTVVAGPYTFPEDMKTLFCVDSGAQPLPEEPEEEEEEEPLVEDQIALVEEEEEGAEVGQEVADETLKPGQLKRKAQRQKARQAARKAGRKAARKKLRKGKKQAERAQRKQKVQQIRQQIRQAGMRVTRWRIRQRLRQENLGNPEEQATQSPAEAITKRPRWAKKQARKARKQARKVKKPWRRLRKEARKNRRMQWAQGMAQGENGTRSVEFNDTESSAESKMDEHDEVNILLTMIEAQSRNETESEGDAQFQEEEAAGFEEENEVGDAGSAPQGRRQGRRERRKKQHKRNKGKAKKKTPTHGMRFCCKFGIARKKMILNITAAENPMPCSNPEDVVATFAEYKFNIAEDTCHSRFTECCNTFTRAIWEMNQERKTARKQRRKQNRKARRQMSRRQKQEETESA
ncbi:golgin subfamily A member 6-like protein 24 isoform X2 [Penaeus indicus]|uniref:golgin subfamily A member 6-like protein 24 isoform X2 n=1 Tax=Penaeus indicus TaxID=29960 RepID=UPI00300C5E2C